MKYAQIIKNASKIKNVSQETLNQINKFSRRPLSSDEVYVFDMILCDNEVDRDNERFSDDSLETLKNMFIGKTGIFDHVPTGSNQTSRIFFCEVVTDNSKLNSVGQAYKYLHAKAYMVVSEKNKDLILEIDAGIKKEISVGCAVKSKICSICGQDNKISRCAHTPGKEYMVDGKSLTCFLSLEEPLDAYEWSFVAVPAQINAGIIKNFIQNHSLKKVENFQTIEETDFSELKKSMNKVLESSQPCFISSQSLKSLVTHIKHLEANVSVYNDCLNTLKSDVTKMLVISQPLLSSGSIKQIVDGLSYDELKKFKTDLSLALKDKPSTPQLTPVIESQKDEPSLPNSVFTL